MSGNKKTPVEFFFSELERMQYFIGNDIYAVYKEALQMEKALNVKNFYDGKSAGEQSWSLDKQDVIEKHAIEFYKWMREVDTLGNAEQYFHFSNEDMYDVWLEEKKGHTK